MKSWEGKSKGVFRTDSTVIAISHRYYEGVTENYDYVIELKMVRFTVIPPRTILMRC